MLILLPSEYYCIEKIEPDYATEYEAICNIPEFKTILYNYDGFVAGDKLKTYPSDYYAGDCIYRGWMLTPEQYSLLYNTLSDRGITLINSPYEYNACHLFPSVRDALGNHTPTSLCFEHGEDIDWDLVNSTFRRFFIKDYVKSVKGHGFPDFFETPVTSEIMSAHISSFIELRGNLYTGGIVLKEYVDLMRYGSFTNEYRAFYLFRELLSLCRNSNQPDSCATVPLDFVKRFADLPSNYYTVDFAELADGRWIVIETGDGQVSGLSPNQFAFKYYDDMKTVLRHSKIANQDANCK